MAVSGGGLAFGIGPLGARECYDAADSYGGVGALVVYE